MRVLKVAAAGLCAGALLAPLSLQAQSPSGTIMVNRGSFEVTPFAGVMLTQKFAHAYGTDLGPANTGIYGVQAGLPLAPGASLLGAVAYSGGNLEAGIPLVGGISVGNSKTYIYEGAVQLRADSWEAQGRRLIPLAQLGAGAIHRDISVSGLHARTTDFMVSGGLGVDVPVTQSVAVRVLAKDYVAKASFGSYYLGSLGTLDANTKELNNVALTAGIRFTF